MLKWISKNQSWRSSLHLFIFIFLHTLIYISSYFIRSYFSFFSYLTWIRRKCYCDYSQTCNVERFLDVPWTFLMFVDLVLSDSLGSAGLKGKIRSESLRISSSSSSEQMNSIIRVGILEMNFFKIIAILQCRNGDDNNNNNVNGNQSLIRTHKNEKMIDLSTCLLFFYFFYALFLCFLFFTFSF
jgi:hypothetical protein